ncbi:YtxH domain-containing protein [Aeromicrobium alkaliterrae]|uniref:PrgI family protein n=1 Tax=Aeromicrobium alkaliterrae TaxID=302168 RepID=A0ABN2K928_9ACTN
MSNVEQRTYGNFRRPESPGLPGLGTAGTVVVFGGALVAVFLVALRIWVPFLIWLPIWLLLVALMAVKDRHGRTAGSRVATRVSWWRARRGGTTVYRSGPLGRTDHGTYQLPGLLAATVLHEAQDAYGRPFAMLQYPQVGHYSVTMSVTPDGASLVDQSQIDAWVAGWGQWLADLGNELGVVAAQVTVETAPDSGARLRREVSSRMREANDAPELATQMLNEVMNDYPSGSSQDRAWVSVTFSGRTPSGKRRDADEMARDIGSRLATMTQSLSNATGAGAATPVTAAELCEIVRTAYDPQAISDFDLARDESRDPEITWSDGVGPAAAEEHWDHYFHDGAVSRTWFMSVAPRGEVYSSVLARLLSPHSDIDRKRISLLYRPVSAGRAADTVERDKRVSDVKVSSSKRPSARAMGARAAAYQTAAEEARGAGLTDFALIATATVLDESRMTDAAVALESLSATARLLMRPAYGSQAPAFAAGLPLGLVLPAHSRVPIEVREYL